MNDPALSQKITELADEYIKRMERYEDPAWQDAEQVKAMLQGMIVGSCFAPDGFQKILKIIDVDQGTDADGVYQPWFTVSFQSGAQVRVSLEVTKPSVVVPHTAQP